jgi:hypothetical protein
MNIFTNKRTGTVQKVQKNQREAVNVVLLSLRLFLVSSSRKPTAVSVYTKTEEDNAFSETVGSVQTVDVLRSGKRNNKKK